jgi:flagellar M-ring protein FliF
MEPLLKQLRELPQSLRALPQTVRYALLAAVVAVGALAAVAATVAGATDRYSYAFTNLSPEDSTEAAGALKSAGVPFRLEAGGAAVAVPQDKVYDARLLLASAGIPRGGGAGFELFDRGDLGVSEFTQKVNLRRATEGELARTIGHLTFVRSARVHLTLEERGLYKDDEHKAAATVVLNLQPGRTLGDRELAGIRHLVAASVSGMLPEGVAIVDGQGAVLATDAVGGPGSGSQRDVERGLEQRLVALLEPVVGAGAVVAKVSATMDASELTTSAEVYDPASATLRSERKVTQTQSQDSTSPVGLAGAAANQPLGPLLGQGPSAAPTAGSKGASNMDDQTKNYEINKTTTRTQSRAPRLQRLSVAVLLDGVGGKPRDEAEVKHLGELARRAVGLDAARGDQFEISSVAFSHVGDEAARPALAAEVPWRQVATAAALLVAALVAWRLLRRSKVKVAQPLALAPGTTVAALQASLAKEPAGAAGTPAAVAGSDPKALPTAEQALRERAQQLTQLAPDRAALLLKAWIAQDQKAEVPRG